MFISGIFNNVQLSPAQTLRTQTSCQFSGLTRDLKGRRWLSPDSFKKVIEQSSNPYVGFIPNDIVLALPENKKSIYQALDELAPVLRSLRSLNQCHLKFSIAPKTADQNTALPTKLKTHVKLQKLGSGELGSVYKLSIKNPDNKADKKTLEYALKVYHHPGYADTNSNHGTYGELATALYFSENPLKDIAQFYFGNPKAGWGVFELITPDMDVSKRLGSSIHQFNVTEQDTSNENSINGIRVDYGGITKNNTNQQEPITLHNLNDFKRALKSGRFVDSNTELVISQIRKLPKETRQEAFFYAWHTGLAKVKQWTLQYGFHCLTAENKIKLFNAALNEKPYEIQVANCANLKFLPSHYRHNALQSILNTGNIGLQKIAAEQISAIPDLFILKDFKALLKTDRYEVQETLIQQIPNLPSKYRKQALIQVMKTKLPTLQAKAIQQLYSLAEQQVAPIIKQVMSGTQTELQTQLVQQIDRLPAAVQFPLFEQGIQSNTPSIQIATATQLYALPKAFRYQAWNQAYQLNSKLINRQIAWQIDSLPLYNRPLAFDKLIASTDAETQASACTQIFSLPPEYRLNAVLKGLSAKLPSTRAAAASQIEYLAPQEQRNTLKIYLQAINKQRPFKTVKRLHVVFGEAV